MDNKWLSIDKLEVGKEVLLSNGVNIFLGKKILIKKSFFSKIISEAFERSCGTVIHDDTTHALPNIFMEKPKLPEKKFGFTNT